MLLSRFILPGVWSQGRVWVSHVPREPRCAFALLFDPGGPRRLALTAFGCCSRLSDNESSSDVTLFRGSIARLQHWLFTLRAALSDDYAKLASGGGQLSRVGFQCTH